MLLNDENIEYAFLGGVFPIEMEEHIKANSIGPIQYAANVLQWNFINGIEKNIGYPVKLINCMFIGSFPKRYHDAIIKTQKFSHVLGSDDINIGFLNITIIKQIILPILIQKALKEWVFNNSNRQKVLIVYSANYVDVINYVKKIDPTIHICLILPDLPMYMNIGKSMLYRIINYKNRIMLNKTVNNIDSFVFLTKQMSEYLRIASNSYTVVEGMIDNTEYVTQQETKEVQHCSVKQIVYTGTLTRQYGVMDLINAFLEIPDNNMQLIICGDGEAREDVIKVSENDTRIKYMGIISHQEARRMQRNATALVNPRQNIGAYTKYSFPSKTMEYLLSGVPVICYKLDGIPEEYDDYLFYVQEEEINSYENLKNKILEICSLSEDNRIKLGTKGREFVLCKKNNSVQTKKVLDMIMFGLQNTNK